MLFVKIAPDICLHRKMRKLSDSAFRLYIASIGWAFEYCTDGFVAAGELELLTDLVPAGGVTVSYRDLADELVRTRLWENADGGWLVHDYLDNQLSTARRDELREANTARQRRHRAATRDTRVTNAPVTRDSPPPSASHPSSFGRSDDGCDAHSGTADDGCDAGRVFADDGCDVASTGTDLAVRDVTRDTRVSNALRVRGRVRATPEELSSADGGPAAPARRRPPDVAGFEQWYALYPRKASKAEARRAFAKAVTKAPLDTLCAAAVRYRDDPNREPAFTKLPGTWLNGECWSDEPLPPRRNPAQRRQEDLLELVDRMRAADDADRGIGGVR